MSHRGDPNKRFYGAITVSDRGLRHGLLAERFGLTRSG